MNEAQSKQPRSGDPGAQERSGENVVEGVETLAAGTKSKGVQKRPSRAKPRRAPVEKVQGDEDMTEGQNVSGSGGAESGKAGSGNTGTDEQSSGGSAASTPVEEPDAPTSSEVSGAAQSMAGGRVSDRVSADDRRHSAPNEPRGRQPGNDHASLDGPTQIGSLLGARMRDNRGLVGLVGVVALIAFLLGRSSRRPG